jgi:hypothetical protein
LTKRESPKNEMGDCPVTCEIGRRDGGRATKVMAEDMEAFNTFGVHRFNHVLRDRARL